MFAKTGYSSETKLKITINMPYGTYRVIALPHLRKTLKTGNFYVRKFLFK